MMHTELYNVVSCRVAAHFVSLWIRTTQRRMVSRVFVMAWHAKLPPITTQLIYDFADWTADVDHTFYAGRFL